MYLIHLFYFFLPYIIIIKFYKNWLKKNINNLGKSDNIWGFFMESGIKNWNTNSWHHLNLILILQEYHKTYSCHIPVELDSDSSDVRLLLFSVLYVEIWIFRKLFIIMNSYTWGRHLQSVEIFQWDSREKVYHYTNNSLV